MPRLEAAEPNWPGLEEPPCRNLRNRSCLLKNLLSRNCHRPIQSARLFPGQDQLIQVCHHR
jgi:hypothetical protein